MGSLAPHKFVKLTKLNPEFVEMPQIDISDDLFNYMLEVYMENCIELSIPSRRAQVNHVSNAVMIGIHNLFPIDKDDDKYAISLKKYIYIKEFAWAVIKNVLGFDFDNNPGEHPIWLTEDHCTNILAILKIGLGKESIKKRVSPLNDFEPFLQN